MRSKAKKKYKNPVRTRTIRVYPNKEDKQLLKKYFGVHRWVYNYGVPFARKYMNGDREALDMVNKYISDSERTIENGKQIRISKKDAVRKILRKYKDEIVNKKWIGEVPECIRDTAVSDLVNAIFATKAAEFEVRNSGEKRKGAFMSFRTKKSKQQLFSFPKRELSERKGGKIVSLVNRFRKNEKLPIATSEVKMTMDRLGKFSMIFPLEVEIKQESEGPSLNNHSVCVLDPGDRTFQTIYDVDGKVIHWGVSDKKKLQYLMKQQDNIQQKISNKRATWGLRKAYFRYIEHIKNKIKEIHRKLVLFLCKNYRVVIIGDMSTQSCINNKKGNRKINNSIARTLQQWSHYTFRQKLKSKAEIYPWCTIIEQNEAMTSKTCGKCGKYNNVGSSKYYSCSCGFSIDRDLNGARNILLRYLSNK